MTEQEKFVALPIGPDGLALIIDHFQGSITRLLHIDDLSDGDIRQISDMKTCFDVIVNAYTKVTGISL